MTDNYKTRSDVAVNDGWDVPRIDRQNLGDDVGVEGPIWVRDGDLHPTLRRAVNVACHALANNLLKQGSQVGRAQVWFSTLQEVKHVPPKRVAAAHMVVP